MKFVKAMKDQKGFSIIELMIVVGIIGVLATMAVPKFQSFQAKAKRAEVKTTLGHIFTLEEAYALDNNAYLAFTTYGDDAASGSNCAVAAATTLGFTLQPCNNTLPRYGYSVSTAVAPFTGTGVTGVSANNKVIPGCATADTWTVAGASNTIANTTDALAACL